MDNKEKKKVVTAKEKVDSKDIEISEESITIENTEERPGIGIEIVVGGTGGN